MEVKVVVYIDTEKTPSDILYIINTVVLATGLQSNYSYASPESELDKVRLLLDEEQYIEADQLLDDIIAIYGSTPDSVGMKAQIFTLASF